MPNSKGRVSIAVTDLLHERIGCHRAHPRQSLNAVIEAAFDRWDAMERTADGAIVPAGAREITTAL